VPYKNDRSASLRCLLIGTDLRVSSDLLAGFHLSAPTLPPRLINLIINKADKSQE
jgi:hypothetical protein